MTALLWLLVAGVVIFLASACARTADREERPHHRFDWHDY